MICFSESAQAALLALGDGDAVALAGSLKVGTWQAKDGTHRPSLDVTVAQVLTAYHVTRKRKAMTPEQDGGSSTTQRRAQPGPFPDDLDDGRPLDF